MACRLEKMSNIMKDCVAEFYGNKDGEISTEEIRAVRVALLEHPTPSRVSRLCMISPVCACSVRFLFVGPPPDQSHDFSCIDFLDT